MGVTSTQSQHGRPAPGLTFTHESDRSDDAFDTGDASAFGGESAAACRWAGDEPSPATSGPGDERAGRSWLASVPAPSAAIGIDAADVISTGAPAVAVGACSSGSGQGTAVVDVCEAVVVSTVTEAGWPEC